MSAQDNTFLGSQARFTQARPDQVAPEHGLFSRNYLTTTIARLDCKCNLITK